MKILIFGGTTEGSILANELVKRAHSIYLSVATAYGKELAPKEQENLQVFWGRLDVEGIIEFASVHEIDCIIDATHPYAVEVSKNIREASRSVNCIYKRLLREESPYEAHVILVDTIENACKHVAEGNVLAATGSKQIHAFVGLDDYKNRLYARVLPTSESIELCENIGLEKEHILTSFGVLSVEENLKMIETYAIRTMITKDGGAKGGFHEKSEACKRAGVRLLVVKRPEECVGYSLEEILEETI